MKKTTLLTLLALLILNTSVFGELTQSDLDKLDKMFRDSEERMKVYIDLKIETVREEIKGLDNKLTGEINVVREEIKGVKGSVSMLFAFVIALIAIAVGLPQYLLARRTKEMELYLERIDALSREVEALKKHIADS